MPPKILPKSNACHCNEKGKDKCKCAAQESCSKKIMKLFIDAVVTYNYKNWCFNAWTNFGTTQKMMNKKLSGHYGT